ncbi:MAG: glycosyltransferase family 39 protein [Methanobacteriaceae archaeon]|nr:glycosyltransferase family 39 protein [Methanobacteriaceae archaeon]
MEFSKDMNINKLDFPYILFLLIFSLLITTQIIIFNNQIGIYCSDVFIYLLNSLNFTGVNINANGSMYLSPIICFITSLFFRAGYVNINAIYIVTGIFAIIGILGFYILLKYNFNKILSLIGSILLFSLSLNLLWLANGTLDIPAIGLTIWTMIFFILSVDKDSKYYLIALPLFVLSFFTRYTAVLILPAMIVYFLGKHDIFTGLDNLISDRKALKKQLTGFLKSKELKNILKALIISLILLALFLIIIYSFSNSLNFLSQSSAVNSGFKTRTIDTAYTTNTFFYITNFLNFLFAGKITFYKNIPTLYNPTLTSYLVMFITILGLILGLTTKFKNKKLRKTNLNGLSDYKSKNNEIETYETSKTKDYKTKEIKIPENTVKKVVEKPEDFKTKNFFLALKLIFIVTLIFSILSFNKISSTITILLTTLDIIILSELLKKYEIKNLNYNLMMLTWFVVYLISFTYINIKVNRYILTLMPAFIYFFTLGLYYIEKQLDFNFKIFKRQINTSQILAIVLIVIFIFSAFNFTSTVTVDDNIKSPQIISEYLKHYDPDYQSKEIGVYNKRPFSWFLKMNLFGITKENRNYLINSNITYYIANEKVNNLTNYHLIKNEGNLYLYERN